MEISIQLASFLLFFIKAVDIDQDFFFNIANYNVWFSVSYDTAPVMLMDLTSVQFLGAPPVYWTLYTQDVPYLKNVFLSLHSSSPQYLEPFKDIMFKGLD